MSDTGVIAGIAIAITAGGAGAYLLTRPKPTNNLASITLTASSKSVTVGDSVSFTATAYDSTNNPLSNVSLTLFDKSTATSQTLGTTTTNGTITGSLTFKNTGTFVLYAEGPSSTIQSNTVTITVKAATTTPTLTIIKLTSNTTSVSVNGTVNFTATAYDQNGKVMNGQTVKILDTSDQVVVANGSTNTSGQISGSEKYTRAGTYTVQASGEGITSNTITITVTVSNAISSLKLMVSTNSAVAGSLITFTAHAYGANNSNLSGIALTLIEQSTSFTANFDEATGASGTAQVSVTLNNTGTFVFYCEPTNATSPQSNTVSVTIAPIPVCNSQQYYDSGLQQCVCYSNNASNLSLSQPSTPTLFMQSQMVITEAILTFRDSAKACWINPTSSGTCPTFLFGGSPSCLTSNIQFIKVNGSVTDANGNPCGDQGVCQLYELYFWLQNYSKEFTISQSSDSWKVKLTYGIFDSNYNEITDSSGNINSGIYPDKSGNFTIYIGVQLSLINVSGQTFSTSVTGPKETIVISLNSGFSPNVGATGGSVAITFYVQDCVYTVAYG